MWLCIEMHKIPIWLYSMKVYGKVCEFKRSVKRNKCKYIEVYNNLRKCIEVNVNL